MLLTGTFARSIDEKQRIAIPKPIRDVLFTADSAILFIAPGTDASLAIYTEDSFTALGRRLAENSPAQQDVRAFSRLFYAQAQRVEADGQGRIKIPTELVQLADLKKEAVLLGVQDHLELWDRERWQAYLTEKLARYDAIAEAAFARPGLV